jgi:hypothetical protein
LSAAALIIFSAMPRRHYYAMLDVISPPFSMPPLMPFDITRRRRFFAIIYFADLLMPCHYAAVTLPLFSMPFYAFAAAMMPR